MAQLIEMRRRIKAIETIKKITHAMRLVAMSTHTRLKHKQEPLKIYKSSLNTLLFKIKHMVSEWHNEWIEPNSHHKKKLILLIGSQKGLCGSFNTALFSFFEKYKHEHGLTNLSLITIGKKAFDYQAEHKSGSLIFKHNELTSITLPTIAHQITTLIMNQKEPFSQVLVMSNYLKTFFIQKPQVTVLIPFSLQQTTSDSQTQFEDYVWEQSPEHILDMLSKQCIDAQLQYLLFESLLAEHAARFISMDNSMRNARNLLDATKLDYNKLRQAKITKELSELAGSFQL